MRQERRRGGGQRLRAAGRLGAWTTLGLLVLLAIALWAGSPSAPPAVRIEGRGLPPPPPAPILSGPEQVDLAAIARRAEIAAEEARLAALRDARRRLEQELEALRQSAEELQRDPAPPAAEAPARQPGPLVAPPAESERRALRIVVLHRVDSAPAAAAASAVSETLRADGFEVQALRGAAFVPSIPVVRYFHDADRAAATALAERLGPGWAAQDFRAFQPQPPPQTLEVWLPAS